MRAQAVLETRGRAGRRESGMRDGFALDPARTDDGAGKWKHAASSGQRCAAAEADVQGAEAGPGGLSDEDRAAGF